MWNWAGLDGFTLYKVIRIAVRPVKGEFWKLSAQRDGGGRQLGGCICVTAKVAAEKHAMAPTPSFGSFGDSLSRKRNFAQICHCSLLHPDTSQVTRAAACSCLHSRYLVNFAAAATSVTRETISI